MEGLVVHVIKRLEMERTNPQNTKNGAFLSTDSKYLGLPRGLDLDSLVPIKDRAKKNSAAGRIDIGGKRRRASIGDAGAMQNANKIKRLLAGSFIYKQSYKG